MCVFNYGFLCEKKGSAYVRARLKMCVCIFVRVCVCVRLRVCNGGFLCKGKGVCVCVWLSVL